MGVLRVPDGQNMTSGYGSIGLSKKKYFTGPYHETTECCLFRKYTRFEQNFFCFSDATSKTKIDPISEF